MFKGNHTEETKKRMSESQKRRYERETAEQKETRIKHQREYYKKANELLQKEIEQNLYNAHKEFVVREYNRLKANGEI